MPRRRRKSRRNPFVFGRPTANREDQGQMYEVYTRSEIDRLLAAMVAEQSAPVEQPRSRREGASRPAARQTGRSKEKRKPRRTDPIEWPQAEVLGRTLGNMKTWCPNLAQMIQAAKDAGKQGLSRRDALEAMGITYGLAEDILAELKKYPLPDKNDPQRKEVEADRQYLAREMLAEAGFSCTIKQPSRSRSRRRSPDDDLQAALGRIAKLGPAF